MARLPVVVWALAAVLDYENKGEKVEDGGAWLLEHIQDGASMCLDVQSPESDVTNRCPAFSSCGHTLPVSPTPPRSLVFCCSGTGSCKNSPSTICPTGREAWMALHHVRRENLCSLVLVASLQELLPATARRTTSSDHPRSSSLYWAAPCQQAFS